jgi:purine-binding chemotaxis protein CheW
MISETENVNADGTKAEPGRFLIFTLAQKPFAIPLMKVKEVIAVKDVTPIPQSPPYFRGVMNLRGLVIPIMDLKTKLGMNVKGQPETSVIIMDMGNTSIGVVVDSVDSVASFEAGDISPPPAGITPGAGKHLSGVAKRENDLVLLMDPSCILNIAEQKFARQAQSA